MEDFFDRLATALAARVAGDIRDEWIDQQHTPLGRNRHCAVVRRRIAEAEPGSDPGAQRIGRRYLLTTTALREEMRRYSMAPVRKPPAPAAPAAPANDSHVSLLRAKLRAVRG
jgi:hypothetical protein